MVGNQASHAAHCYSSFDLQIFVHMISLTAERTHKIIPMYSVTLSGEGKVLQLLLQLLKMSRVYNRTVSNEMSQESIETVIKQIESGK